jgi:hypothetical protein
MSSDLREQAEEDAEEQQDTIERLRGELNAKLDAIAAKLDSK